MIVYRIFTLPISAQPWAYDQNGAQSDQSLLVDQLKNREKVTVEVVKQYQQFDQVQNCDGLWGHLAITDLTC